jgi:Arc/MetJ family transcription regulator
MATNLNLDDALIEEAVLRGGHGSKREAVNEALRAYVDHLRQLEAVREFGSFVFDPKFDHKQARRDRRSA